MNGARRKPTTVRELLRVSAAWLAEQGIESADLEAQLLLAEALGCRRIDLFMDHDRPLAPEERDRFRALARRRGQAREPLAYILGRREFFGFEFRVGPAVLVPRPESEHLVEAALEELDRRSLRRERFDGELPHSADEAHPEGESGEGSESGARPRPEAAARADAPSPTEIDAAGGKAGAAAAPSPVRVADVGAGSGCIGIALARLRPEAQVLACDRSAAALAVARENAAALGVAERVRLVHGDLLSFVAAGTLDLVLSNPPYVGEDEVELLSPEVRAHEPREALFDRPGLPLTQRLVEQAHEALAPGGLLAVETGQGSAERVAAFFASAGFAKVRTLRDLAGIERVVLGRRSP
ncbi:MAG: peptide chain release factor N(5)-glutamine methyltransferase [Planctomycetota bacterium]|nr:MAG: peptide chain release factor N(5)-glutamine methyltransferase [Planctomycetota bacterium]